ncbi:hypothetical protein SK128_011815, partial [Halocaridina rubra]
MKRRSQVDMSVPPLHYVTSEEFSSKPKKCSSKLENGLKKNTLSDSKQAKIFPRVLKPLTKRKCSKLLKKKATLTKKYLKLEAEMRKLTQQVNMLDHEINHIIEEPTEDLLKVPERPLSIGSSPLDIGNLSGSSVHNPNAYVLAQRDFTFKGGSNKKRVGNSMNSNTPAKSRGHPKKNLDMDGYDALASAVLVKVVPQYPSTKKRCLSSTSNVAKYSEGRQFQKKSNPQGILLKNVKVAIEMDLKDRSENNYRNKTNDCNEGHDDNFAVSARHSKLLRNRSDNPQVDGAFNSKCNLDEPERVHRSVNDALVGTGKHQELVTKKKPRKYTRNVGIFLKGCTGKTKNKQIPKNVTFQEAKLETLERTGLKRKIIQDDKIESNKRSFENGNHHPEESALGNKDHVLETFPVHGPPSFDTFCRPQNRLVGAKNSKPKSREDKIVEESEKHVSSGSVCTLNTSSPVSLRGMKPGFSSVERMHPSTETRPSQNYVVIKDSKAKILNNGQTKGILKSNKASSNGSKNGYFCCPLCPECYENPDTLVDHYKFFHAKHRPYICKFEGCPALLQRQNSQKHLQSHLFKRNFNCPYCSYSQKNMCLLKHHLVIHEQ